MIIMKKKCFRLLALAGALFLIFILGWTANGLVGNPISQHLAAKSAQKYLTEHFPDTDYYIAETSYSFKDSSYVADVKAPDSMDRYFSIYLDMAGRYRWDSYENVKEKFTTFLRLDEEYRKLADSVLESASFPCPGDIMYGELQIYAREDAQDDEDGIVPDYAQVQEALELDKIYDIRQLGAQVGKLVIYVESDSITAEQAAKDILAIRRVMDNAGVPFYAMEFHLEEPLPEDGGRREKSIDVLEILYEDIQEESMVQRVKQADEAAKEYYAQEDKEFEEEYGALE